MGIIGSILLGIGGIVMFVGGIMLLVVAFKESVLWGLGSMFVPFVGLVFLIKFWAKAKKPFFIQLAGLPFYLIGMAITATQVAQTAGGM